MTIDSLTQVFSIYETLKDSIKVTRRSINKSGDDILHRNTLFWGEQKDEMLNKISSVEIELDDIMILSLFASFERELRTSVQHIICSNSSQNSPIIIRFIAMTSESVERWTIKEIIDAFDGVVDEKLRSIVKQIYDYRNWVAHGKNPNKPPPIKTDPKTVFFNLRDFSKQASIIL